jgi:hypothetical protein
VGFWGNVLAEALGSVPVFAVGLYLSHRGLKRHLTRVTRKQTGDIRVITDEQTSELERRRAAGAGRNTGHGPS